MGDTKNHTPPSGKSMPCGPESPLGVKRNKFPDGESPNCVNNFDGSKAVFPVRELDYLPGANGSK